MEHDQNIPWIEKADPRCPLVFGAWYKDSTKQGDGGIASNCGISTHIRHVLKSMSDEAVWECYLVQQKEQTNDV